MEYGSHGSTVRGGAGGDGKSKPSMLLRCHRVLRRLGLSVVFIQVPLVLCRAVPIWWLALRTRRPRRLLSPRLKTSSRPILCWSRCLLSLPSTCFDHLTGRAPQAFARLAPWVLVFVRIYNQCGLFVLNLACARGVALPVVMQCCVDESKLLCRNACDVFVVNMSRRQLVPNRLKRSTARITPYSGRGCSCA